MSFFMLGADKKLKKDNKLVKLNLLIDWTKVKKHLKKNMGIYHIPSMN